MSRNIPKQLLQGCVLWLDSAGKDLSGNLNNGTLVNTPTKVRVLQNDGLSYNGSNQYVSSIGSFSINGNFTISAWIKPLTQTTYSNNTIIDIGNLTANTGFGMWISGPEKVEGVNKLTWRINSIYDNYAAINHTFTSGVTYFVSVVYNGTDVKTYVNGVLISTIAFTTNPLGSSLVGTTGVRIDNSLEWYKGIEINPMIWNRALSAKEIEMLYYSTFIK